MTAVRSDDEQPSVYLDIVDPPEEGDASDELRPFDDVDRAMTLSALVAELRREVVNRRRRRPGARPRRTTWPGWPPRACRAPTPPPGGP